MKMKSILFALTLSGISAFGQGLVTFQNTTLMTPIQIDYDGPNFGADPVNIPGGGDYSFFFIYGLDAGNLNNTSATYLSGSPGRITTTGTAHIALNTPGATPTFFQMFAYLTSHGSYAQAALQGSFLDHYQSGIISLTPTVSPSPGQPMFGTSVGTQFQGFIFQAPEPSTYVMGILGAGSLLLFRRKKK
jgi:hypothetical protein